MYILGYCKLKCFVYPAIDICTVVIKNIKNLHAVSTNQIADILHFNDKYIIYNIYTYMYIIYCIYYIIYYVYLYS